MWRMSQTRSANPRIEKPSTTKAAPSDISICVSHFSISSFSLFLFSFIGFMELGERGYLLFRSISFAVSVFG